jgi:hypothetical protein
MADAPTAVLNATLAAVGGPAIAPRATVSLVHITVASDGSAPIIEDFDPPLGTGVARNDALSFTLRDPSGDLALRMVFVAFGTRNAYELAYDGNGFRIPYLGSSSSPVTGGARYTLRRTGGWPIVAAKTALRLRVIACDRAGNLVEVNLA